jgi:hypothetical protein
MAILVQSETFQPDFCSCSRLLVDQGYQIKTYLMKRMNLLLLALVLIALNSCTLVAGIFKSGVILWLLAVIVLIAIIAWIIAMLRK